MPAAKSARSRKIVLAGAGRMGAAMLDGWLRGARKGGPIFHVVEPAPSDHLKDLAARGAIVLNAGPSAADILVIAVKPQAFGAAANDLSGWCGPGAVAVSIMAGVTLRRIEGALGVKRVIRAMPNTPGAIGKGVTAYAASSDCRVADRKAAEKLLAPLGVVVGPLDESRMDAVTAVSGSGPAYVFLLAETLEAAGRAAGLEPEVASQLARQTVVGAGALLEGRDPTELRKAVTSPGGTTAAALDVLLATGALPDLMRRAVEAAARRGAELSRE